VTRARRMLERTVATLDLFGNPWGTRSIIESAAMAAEWAESAAAWRRCARWPGTGADPYTAEYPQCLERGFEVIRADDLPSSASTYVALSELALQAPCCPNMRRCARATWIRASFFPRLRFPSLLTVASEVAPLQSLADAGRLCQ